MRAIYWAGVDSLAKSNSCSCWCLEFVFRPRKKLQFLRGMRQQRNSTLPLHPETRHTDSEMVYGHFMTYARYFYAVAISFPARRADPCTSAVGHTAEFHLNAPTEWARRVCARAMVNNPDNETEIDRPAVRMSVFYCSIVHHVTSLFSVLILQRSEDSHSRCWSIGWPGRFPLSSWLVIRFWSWRSTVGRGMNHGRTYI